MNYINHFLLLSVLFVGGSQAEDGVTLICPTGYIVKGQAWYAESSYDNTNIDKAEKSKDDNNLRLTIPSYEYHPQEYSVCAICINYDAAIEVEICISHENMRKENLAYERRGSTDGHSGTLVWNQAVNPTGLRVDMSKKDLLSTLQAIEAVNDSSFQKENLSCPTGFKLDKFQSSERIYKYQENTIDTKIVPCIVCSDQNRLSSSSCVAESTSTFYGSALLPSQFFNGPCKFNMQPSLNGCQSDPNSSTNNGKPLCGVNLNPKQFKDKIWTLSLYNYNSNCPEIGSQGKSATETTTELEESCYCAGQTIHLIIIGVLSTLAFLFLIVILIQYLYNKNQKGPHNTKIGNLGDKHPQNSNQGENQPDESANDLYNTYRIEKIYLAEDLEMPKNPRDKTRV